MRAELSPLKAAYQKVLETNALLHQALEKACERIKVLEGQLAKNSRNSSKPPSSDNFKKPKPKSQRETGKQTTGGQKGHLGITLSQVETPDVVVKHAAEVCKKYQRSLTGALLSGFEKRQEFDLPPIQPVVTEHQAEIKICPVCGCKNKGEFPENITQPVQHGPRSKAIASYLSHYQLLPYARLTELFGDVFKFPLSEAGLFSSLESHARRIYGMVLDTTFEAFSKLSKAEELLAWMKKQSKGTEASLTRGFIMRYSKFRSSKDLDLLLLDLIQMGYIQEVSLNTYCLLLQEN